MSSWFSSLSTEQLSFWWTFTNYAAIVLSAALLMVAIGKQGLSNEKDKRTGIDKITMQQRIEHATQVANQSVSDLAKNQERLVKSERELSKTEQEVKASAEEAAQAVRLYHQAKEDLAIVDARTTAIANLQMDFELYANVPITTPTEVNPTVVLYSNIQLKNYPLDRPVTVLMFEGHSVIATPATLPYGPPNVKCTKYHFVLDYIGLDTGPNPETSHFTS
jgi:hypothetical protein